MTFNFQTIYKAENFEIKQALKELEEWEDAHWFEENPYKKKFAEFMVQEKIDKFNKVLDKYERYH